MISPRQLRAAAASLTQHKLRSSLSALGIVFGVGATVAMLAVAEGARREILAQIAQLGTDNLIVRRLELSDVQERQARRELSQGLTMGDVELLEAIPGVASAAPLSELSVGVLDAGTDQPPEVVATTRAYFSAKGLAPSEGRLLCDADLLDSSLVCVLGAAASEALGPLGRPGAKLRIEEALCEVVGVLERRSLQGSQRPVVTARDVDRTVFLPMTARTSLRPGISEMLSEISLRMRDAEHLMSGAAMVRRTLDVTHRGMEDYQLIIPTELLAQAFRAQRIFNLVLGAVAAISLLVGGTGIMNIMLANVSERTREIGIRRAVGASQPQIMLHFLTEAMMLTFGGLVLGVGAGALGAYTIAHLAGWSTVVTGWGVLIAASMAAAVGLVSGLYPALRAARLDPIAALRRS